MEGVRIVVDIEGVLPSAIAARLAGADTLQLMTDIGAVLESSMHERVQSTKTAPDGTPWPENKAGTSTLFATGLHLDGTLAFIAQPTVVEAGSSWEYAHIHQDGAVIKPKDAERLSFMVGNRRVFAKKVTIPARAFAGMSADDESEVERVAADWLRDLVTGLP